MQMVCPQCGKEFNGSSRSRYCSRECYGLSKRRRESRVCPVCKNWFEAGGRAGDSLFCSPECAARARYRRGKPANTLTPEQAAYIAGFMDADGSFIIHGRYDGGDSLSFRVQAGGTKEAAIRWIHEVTGVGRIIFAARANPLHADVYEWWVNGDGAQSLAKQLIPYLVLKRPQAELGVDFQERLHYPGLKADRAWQQEYRARMAELNKKGKVV